MKWFETKKDYRKFFRTLLELIVVGLLLYLLLKAFFTLTRYVPYEETQISDEDKSFLALSYLGVDRNGTDTLISTKQLEEQLRALNENGYVTMTQADILAYYEGEQLLPEKTMFLMFEDGRQDTAIFAQNALEENNYIATILTYAEKFEDNEQKSETDLLGAGNQRLPAVLYQCI